MTARWRDVNLKMSTLYIACRDHADGKCYLMNQEAGKHPCYVFQAQFYDKKVIFGLDVEFEMILQALAQ